MSDSGLAQRLRRLRRGGSLAPAGDALSDLEAQLVGEIADGLSLKARLERLVAVAARRTRGVAPVDYPVPLEELIQGRRVLNERGEFFMVEEDVHLETLHGDVPLSRVHAVPTDSVGILNGDEGFDLREAVFLDTETTGLAGGAGTAAFLIGLGWVEGDRFRLRQYFMRDYHEEPALLRALGEDLARFRHLVTYNGKAFDIPLLESRFRLNRDRYPLSDAVHLDLVHPARRLWKARLTSCRLQSLEAALLGVRRHGDVPGEEIPRLYFDFVRRRDGRAMARVLQHNRLDVVSLAALTILAGQWVDLALAEDPRDVYCLARLLERGQRFDRAEAQYRRAIGMGRGRVRVAALLRLAARAKRRGDLAAALPLWEEAGGEGDWLALRELALHHEHRSRDLPAALEAVDRGLDGLDARDPGTPRATADFHRRRDRLLRKLSRRAAPPH
jgi:uncharacterized protein YprB with RNaseH-like and TPR domain